ncbi:hypothetical protein [Nonomuraea sp. NPDC023979]|uniref:hypothetical protein n=1 Tax=Nonomuraea sp. NPDC023979 TaxID=3154796 RepID=UPI003411463A
MAPDAPTTLQIVTLVLSVLGAATGVAALAWNIIQFKLAGPAIKVEATGGVLIDRQALEERGALETTPQIVVRVQNTGRAAIKVRDIEIMPVATPKVGIAWNDWVGVPLPHRLEGYDEATWSIRDVPTLRSMMQQEDRNLSFRAVVILANGRKVKSNYLVADEAILLKGLSMQVVSIPGDVPGEEREVKILKRDAKGS